MTDNTTREQAAHDETVQRLRRRLREQEQELEVLRARVNEGALGVRPGHMNPENVVWMFGTGRSGSTWLSDMMDDLPNHAVWREPLVGALFGHLYYVRPTIAGWARTSTSS